MSRLVPALVALFAVTLSAACVTPNPHVELERAPSLDAPFDERARYYKEHALGTREYNHVFLHGGKRVYWPEDLLPAVDPGSPTALAIQDHVEARERVEEWNWLAYTISGTGYVGAALLLGGVGAMAIPLFADQYDDLGWTLVATGLIGGGAIMLGGLGLVFVHEAIIGEDSGASAEASDRAVKTYPQSLSDRLGVGVNADGVIIDFVRPGTNAPPQADGGRDI